MPGDELAWIAVGTPVNDPIRIVSGDSGEGQQLVLGCVVEIERLVAAPAFAHAFSHGFGVALQRCRGFGSFLFQVLRALLTLRAASQKKNQPST